jgi:NAD(P)-dependent dehydrogenase (short-subunit alcohol dehydrogenase family)
VGRLDERVAIVTGGGSGNGLAIAGAMAQEGAAVVIAEFSRERGRAAADAILAHGGRAVFVQADVSRWSDVDRVVSEAVAQFGELHIMVNNAGVLDGYATCLDTSEELLDRVLAINVKGVFFGCKRALREMVKRGYGKIINIASVAGLKAGAGGTAYTASKHAVVGLTRQLAWEYGPHGIRVNAICPGPVTTRLRETSAEVLGTVAPPMGGGLGAASEEFIRQLIPLGFKGSPEDVAKATMFLASSDSDYINGHTLVLDGGLSIK